MSNSCPRQGINSLGCGGSAGEAGATVTKKPRRVPTRAGYHGLGRAASTVDRHHGGEPCSAQPSNRIDAETRVLPHTSAHARLGEFHYNSRDAADEKRKRVLEHAPRY